MTQERRDELKRQAPAWLAALFAATTIVMNVVPGGFASITDQAIAEQRIETLETAVTDVRENRLSRDRVMGKFGNHERRINELEKRMDQTRAQYETIITQIAKLDTKLDSLSDRLDRAQQKDK